MLNQTLYCFIYADYILDSMSKLGKKDIPFLMSPHLATKIIPLAMMEISENRTIDSKDIVSYETIRETC